MDTRETLLKNNGFLLIELLIAIAIMGILLAYSFRLSTLAMRSTAAVRLETQANELANEYIEMARSRRNEGWSTLGYSDGEVVYNPDDPGEYNIDCDDDNDNIDNLGPCPPADQPSIVKGLPYHFEYDSNLSILKLKPYSESINALGGVVDPKFTRSIVFEEVHRDASDHSITDDVNAPIDNESIKIIVNVQWQLISKTNSVSKEIYLTNWGGF